jgi:microcystin degradation protein MlrC
MTINIEKMRADMRADTRRFRRVSKTLHNRCLEACEVRVGDLTEQEAKTLTAVALGWSEPGTSVTKQDYDAALAILERLSPSRR